MVDQMRRRLRHPPRAGCGAEAAALAVERDELVVAAIATAQAQETVDQDAASRKVSNSSLTDCGAGSGFGWLLIKEDRFLVAITRTQGLGCFDFASVFVRFAARADEALSVYKHNFDIGAMALLPPAQT